MEDALRTFGADEIVISTHPPGRSHWLEQGVVEGARERFDVPVTHVVVDLEKEGGGRSPRLDRQPLARDTRRPMPGAQAVAVDLLNPVPSSRRSPAAAITEAVAGAGQRAPAANQRTIDQDPAAAAFVIDPEAEDVDLAYRSPTDEHAVGVGEA